MSKSPQVEVNGGPGCLLLIGAVIVGICLGNIYSASVGWLAIGGALILCALFSLEPRR